MKRGTAAVLVLAATVWIVAGVRDLAATRGARLNSAEVLAEAEVLRADIAFYRERADRDPFGAADRAMLARLYLRHARETGMSEGLARAESLARRSLALRVAHNAQSWGLLATALMGQHRWDEARVAAESLVAAEPWVPVHRAMLGEIAFEMGRYDVAAPIFDSLRADARGLDVAPRMARWAELNGQLEQARTILRFARDDARGQRHLSRETRAWFALRVGDIEAQLGELDAARAAYDEGLALRPGDYRILTSLARLSALRGHEDEAVRYAMEAIERYDSLRGGALP